MSVKADLSKIEFLIDDLKKRYDLFFQGLIRAEPTAERNELELKLRKMGQRNIPNTSDQFKFDALRARFYSYLNMWSRIVQGIEEGRIERDSGGRVSLQSTGPVEEENLNRTFIEYLNAKKELNQPSDGIEFTAFKTKLLARAMDIAEKKGYEKVEFKVVVEEGKAKIKATKK